MPGSPVLIPHGFHRIQVSDKEERIQFRSQRNEKNHNCLVKKQYWIPAEMKDRLQTHHIKCMRGTSRNGDGMMKKIGNNWNADQRSGQSTLNRQ